MIGGVLWRDAAPQPSAGPSIGPLLRLTSDSGLTTEPSISADGGLIASATDRSGDGNLDIWVQQATGGSAIRLTSDPADDREPDVSPGDSLIAFRSDRTPRGIYVAPPLGGGAPRKVCDDCQVWGLTRDNRRILITEQRDLMLNRLDLATGTRSAAIISPDTSTGRCCRRTSGGWSSTRIAR